jgi:hypothetical protein
MIIGKVAVLSHRLLLERSARFVPSLIQFFGFCIHFFLQNMVVKCASNHQPGRPGLCIYCVSSSDRVAQLYPQIPGSSFHHLLRLTVIK